MELTAPSAQERALFQQGYDYSPQELKTLSWGLRFTPMLCMFGAVSSI